MSDVRCQMSDNCGAMDTNLLEIRSAAYPTSDIRHPTSDIRHPGTLPNVLNPE